MIAIRQIAHHRNGRTGEPFWAVTFTDSEVDGTFLATIFPSSYVDDRLSASWDKLGNWRNARIAVVNVDLLPDVTFGVNSWPGDLYVNALVEAINDHLLPSTALAC